MKLNFLFPGKTKESFLAEGLAFYYKRLKPMVEIQEIILKGSSAPPGSGIQGENAAKAKEAATVLERCGASDFLIVLDVRGEMLSSEGLAEKFKQLQVKGTKTVNLVVGGPWGHDESLLKKANLRLSFSPMTFPHDLARLMLLEQVYRAFAILNNSPYHKGNS